MRCAKPLVYCWALTLVIASVGIYTTIGGVDRTTAAADPPAAVTVSDDGQADASADVTGDSPTKVLPVNVSELSPRERVARKAKKAPKKYDKPGEAAAFYVQQRAPHGEQMPLERYVTARHKIDQMMKNRPVFRDSCDNPGGVVSWDWLGPGNVGGRTRAIVINPNAPDTMYVAGVAGGIWRTDDGGLTWTPQDDFMASLAACTIVMDPDDPNTLYVGTGEGFYNGDAVRGLGVFKTTNGGTTWTQLDATNNSDFYYVNDLKIHREDSQVILLAATRTGVWRSTDEGQNWTQVETGRDSIVGCTELTVSAGTSTTMFAAFGSFYPDGLYISDDLGQNWTVLVIPFPMTPSYMEGYSVVPAASTPAFGQVDVAFNAGTSQLTLDIIVIGYIPAQEIRTIELREGAAGTNGPLVETIFDRSIDGQFAPFSTSVSLTAGQIAKMYATELYLIVTTDDFPGGEIRDQLRSEQGRIALATAPSEPDFVYACVSRNYYSVGTFPFPSGDPENPYIYEFDGMGSLSGVWRTTNAGDTWTQRVDLEDTNINPWLLTNIPFINIVCISACSGYSISSQGWYDNVITVDPLDRERVWVGGIDLFVSGDGAANFTVASHWFLNREDGTPYNHADHHAIVFHPDFDGVSNQIIFFGSDGGIYKTANGRANGSSFGCPFDADCNDDESLWSNILYTTLNNGYGVTQFYDGDSCPTMDLFAGGTQDNGTTLVRPGFGTEGWVEPLGSDGGFTKISQVFSNGLSACSIVWAETLGFSSFYRSIDSGNSFQFAGQLLSGSGLFITPLEMHKTDPAILWTGAEEIWRTLDGNVVIDYPTWEKVSPNFSGPSQVSALAISDDANIVYVGYSNGYIAKTSEALAAEEVVLDSWEVFDSSNGLPTDTYGFISSMAVNPSNFNIAYATVSTFGQTHVYRTEDSGQTWEPRDGALDTSIPDIPAHSIVVSPSDSAALYVGTDLGVFASEDDGLTWAPASSADIGLANTVVEKVGARGLDQLVAFTHGRGAYVADLCFRSDLLLSVVSEPAGVYILATGDNEGLGDGTSNFTRRYNNGVVVALESPPNFVDPETLQEYEFVCWELDGEPQPNGRRQLEVTMNDRRVAEAIYLPRRTLTIESCPSALVLNDADIDPPDLSGLESGTATFARVYFDDTRVFLQAPETHSGGVFSRWVVDDIGRTPGQRQTVIVMNQDRTAKAEYSSCPPAMRGMGDWDGDQDVDLYDFVIFQTCFSGPEGQWTGPGCDLFDYDQDGDVDLLDFFSFQTSYAK